MTIDALRGEELPTVWAWLIAEPELNSDDFGPKTLEDFRAYVDKGSADNTLIVFAVRTGRKLVGAVGFNPAEKCFRGIVFSPDVRGSGMAAKGVLGILEALWHLGVTTVSAKYFVTNERVTGFFRKLGAHFEGFDGHTTQGGVPVQYVKVSFHAPTPQD